MAANPLFIDPEGLVTDGLLPPGVIAAAPEFSPYLVDYKPLVAWNDTVLRRAYAAFVDRGGDPAFDAFRDREAGWLDDYCLFIALKEKFKGRPWFKWAGDLVDRRRESLVAAGDELASEVGFHAFCQFVFFRQWRVLRRHAAAKGVAMVGDMPIYVALDSADVWANQECFRLDAGGAPTVVAGVPPDYFSDTGQLWGNPLYRWFDGNSLNPGLLDWWERRFAAMFRMVDFCRIDHFRAFASCWQIPAGADSAIAGEWVPGPGRAFFTAMAERLGPLALIAEDLGMIGADVHELLDDLGLPGMKVLQFAFDSGSANAYLPHNYPDTNCVVYTGTHDNDTTLGWFMSGRCGEESRTRLRRYCHSDAARVHEDMVRLAMASVAALAMVPMQDFLGYGADCRMNVPGTANGNWCWRLAEGNLTPELSGWIREMVEFYNRG